MCSGRGMYPPYGIPIPVEVHERYSEEVKLAWLTFHSWWQEVMADNDGELIDRTKMPEKVKAAMQLILETPIPGYEEEGYTGKDSCYMIGVGSLMTPLE
ncbi:MAG: hypothetical protein UU94_C0015G0013 [Candidatus Collierbacteria bacterium GW2011_GWB2_42_12]|nr:MAG: hypothetical protein UU94_C0015G0013 [Candidatus Collierbacteria bacterium GW2011_GWB2_42_12]